MHADRIAKLRGEIAAIREQFIRGGFDAQTFPTAAQRERMILEEIRSLTPPQNSDPQAENRTKSFR